MILLEDINEIVGEFDLELFNSSLIQMKKFNIID